MAIVRRAQFGDQVGIHDSHMRSIREICVHDHGEEEIKGWGYREMRSKEQWLQTLDNQNKFVWVVEHENEIEGHCFISLVPEEIKADIHCLYLTPVVYKQGFGAILMEHMLEVAKENNIKEIFLQSTITAYSFYKRYGFEDTGPMQKVEIGGYPVRAFPMKLELHG